MSSLVKLKGKRFGKLLVLRRAGANKWKQALWLVRCDCGTRDIVEGFILYSGPMKTCCWACSHPQRGMTYTHVPEYQSYSAMKQRCLVSVCFEPSGRSVGG